LLRLARLPIPPLPRAGRTSEYNPVLDSRGRGDSTTTTRTPLDILADVVLRHRDCALRIGCRVVGGMDLVVAESSTPCVAGAGGHSRRPHFFRDQTGRQPCRRTETAVDT